jgi:hypothetical protein
MNKLEESFREIFQKELEPTLLLLGFTRVQLSNGWIQPTFLYKYNAASIWFGCSWDWRDFYFEADLGGLYLFKDVLPRVVVYGYNLERKIKKNDIEDYLTEQMKVVKETILRLNKNDFNVYLESIEVVKRKRIQTVSNYVEREIYDLNEL